MVFPDEDRRVIKIRKNHIDRKGARLRQQAIRFTVCGVIFAALLAAGFYFDAPRQISKLYANMKPAKEPVEKMEPEEPEVVVVQEDEKKAAKAKELPTNLVFTGDIVPVEQVQAHYDATGIDGVIEAGLREVLNAADICTINNEFAFSNQGETKKTDYAYRVDPKYVTILKELGVDVAGLANNHTLDFGTDAFLDTFQTLDEAEILRTGAGNSKEESMTPAVVEKNGETFAFLAASHVIPDTSWNIENKQPGMLCFYDETLLLQAVEAASAKYDHVFVLTHWGTMRTTELTDYQKNDAHKIIDAGAQAVIGAHPHILQGIEYYNGGYVFYSLGDFIFTGRIDQTAAVSMTVDDGEISVKLIPATCSNYLTKSADEGKAAAIFEYLRQISPTVNIDEDGNVTPL